MAHAESASVATRVQVPAMLAAARPQHGVPLWVSAEEAFDAHGNVRSDRIVQGRREMIERNRRANPGPDCTLFIGAASETYRPTKTLDDLIANALTIVSGEVLDAEVGFYAGHPGTLLAVRVSERLKTFGRTAIGQLAYVFVEEARITTSRGVICSTAFSAVPLPRAGDRILAFAYFDPADAEGVVLTVEARYQLFVERGETLHAPASAKTSVTSLRALTDAIRAHRLLHAPIGMER